ncbi:pentapeptide repeat-containing protein [Lysobacter sp. CA199]|uniref:pentapeptide repeat-containing protein n=1 Tax=Lysobacter sp. CA199 TaxID=3455608 RepID=UPI003F8D4697
MFATSDLSECNFEGADLGGANLIRVRTTCANLRDADPGLDALGRATQLQGAHFSGAPLHGCRLQGEQYDERTRFPAGFNPQAAGMVETEPRE